MGLLHSHSDSGGGAFLLYATGSTHGDFERIRSFCEEMHMRQEDVMVILGDSGIESSDEAKASLSKVPATILCMQNDVRKENGAMANYTQATWNGGHVLYEPAFPNILFAQDGDIYQIGKLLTLVLNDGLCEDSFRERIFEHLESVDWDVNLVLSSYAPMKYRPADLAPTEGDMAVEHALDPLEDRLKYWVWLCGHYPVQRQLKARMDLLTDDYVEVLE